MPLGFISLAFFKRLECPPLSTYSSKPPFLASSINLYTDPLIPHSKREMEERTVVIKFEELLRDASSFPFLALVAFEVGGLLRLSLLLLLLPLSTTIRLLVSKSAADKILIFGAVAGASLKSLKSTAVAVLPKFFAGELRIESGRVFCYCGRRRCVITEMPRIMAETFLKEYLGAEMVVGTELDSYMGRATGFVTSPGIIFDEDEKETARSLTGNGFLSLSQVGFENSLSSI